MAIYYIDPESGNDSNGGLGSGDPWATWGKITTEGVWAGNTFLGKRGTTAREKIEIGGNNVTIGVYGEGASTHVVRGADIVVNASWSKTGGQTNVYQYAYTAPSGTDSASMVWEDGTQLTSVADIATCDATAGSYVLTGGNMYVHASDSSDVTANAKVYELPGREVCLDFNDSLDCDVQSGVELTGAWSDDSNYGNIRVSGKRNNVKNLQSHDCRRHALQFLDSNLVSCDDNIVDGGKFYDCDGNTVSFFSGAGALGTNRNELKNAEITQEGEPDGRGGLLIMHSSTSRTNPLVGNKLIGNHFHDMTDTTNSWAVILDIEVFDTQIYGNRFENLRGTLACIRFEDNCNGTRFTGNRCFLDINNGFYVLVDGDGNAADDNWVCNNGFVARGSAAVHCVGYQDNATNGKVWNNYFTGIDDDCIRVSDVSSQVGFSSNYNVLHNILDSQPFRWASTNYSFADWKINTGQDANTREIDPQIDSTGLMAEYIPGDVYWGNESAPFDAFGDQFSSTAPSIGPVEFNTQSVRYVGGFGARGLSTNYQITSEKEKKRQRIKMGIIKK